MTTMRMLLSWVVIIGMATGMAQAAGQTRVVKDVAVPKNVPPSEIMLAENAPQEILDLLREGGIIPAPDDVIHIYTEREEGIWWLTYLQSIVNKVLEQFQCLICIGPPALRICIFCK